MESKPKFKPDGGLKLMDQVRQVLRYHHYAYRTEQTYCDPSTRATASGHRPSLGMGSRWKGSL